MITQQVGLRIKELRHKLGISQEDLAARADVHHTHIASLEVGKRNRFAYNLRSADVALTTCHAASLSSRCSVL